eukprot:14398653-Alexandrium_andersonii.AAC.1
MWRKLHRAAWARGEARQWVRLQKVAAHCKEKDIGVRVGFTEWFMNNGADSLAVAGAALHGVPDGIRARVAHRSKLAKATQRMMVSILRARAAWDADTGREAD